MANSKIVYFDETLIDLTGDTVSADKVLSGFTFHDKAGDTQSGTCTYDVDSSGATVGVAEILSGKTAGVRGAMVEGTMPNVGKQTSTITTKAQSVTIGQGYHDGTGRVSISSTEQAKIVAANIAEGVTILGVQGTHKSGTQEVKQSKTVTPSKSQQTVLPDSGYTCLSQVTVEAIPYTTSTNSAGGTTVTIG